MRRSYVVPVRWMVIYEYEVTGRALNLNSTKLSRPWSPWGSSPSRENPHGRTGNRTRELMISSQKLWALDHEAGQSLRFLNVKLVILNCCQQHNFHGVRRRWITHNKAYNIQNTAKVWYQELSLSFKFRHPSVVTLYTSTLLLSRQCCHLRR
jgi:hypothetical protein